MIGLSTERRSSVLPWSGGGGAVAVHPLDGVAGQFEGVGHAQFFTDVHAMGLDGLDAEAELAGDFPGGAGPCR